MKSLILFILVPMLCFSQTQILMSENSILSKALVLKRHFETQKIVFQVCTVQSQSPNKDENYQISDCKIMGKNSGYSAEDINNRIQQLENESSTHALFKTSYLVLGTVVGAMTGGVLAQQLALQTHPSQMYALISFFAGGVIVGGGAGLTLTVLTKQSVGDLISQQLFSNEVQVLETINEVENQNVSVLVLKNSLQKTVNDFNEVLLGIP